MFVQNVMMLMNDKDAAAHDSYLARHMSTGENRIVGKFRVVQCKRKNGKLFEATLSVSKSIDPDDANVIYFTGNIVSSSTLETLPKEESDGSKQFVIHSFKKR